MKKIGFIGTGNMGGALARAVSKTACAENICLADSLPERAAELAEILGCKLSSNEDIAESCDYIFLGVKPQVMEAVLNGISPVLGARKERFVLVSMAAAVPCAQVQEFAGGKYPVIRVMPNTPVAVGKGVLQYCRLDASDDECAEFEALMAYAGLVDALPESLIDAACAVSSCGPAFCYLFIEALADGAVACGLPRDKALAYAAHMVEGSARMVLDTELHPGVLKDQVCSPGGTTIEGVRALEAGGFRSAAIEAVKSAYRKTLEIKDKK